MQIKSILLENFRNFQKLEISFEKGLNVIYAPNGLGKTNIIEAISYLSVPKSFRRALDKNLIRKDVFVEEIDIEDLSTDVLQAINNFARAIGTVLLISGEDEVCDTMEFFIQQNNKTQKTLKINGKKEKLSAFVGNFYSVIFSPETIDIITSTPSKRRWFLDHLISTFDPEYLSSLTRYKEVVRNRNKILGDFNFDESLLDVWDKPLLEYGVKILRSRIKIFSEIAKRIGDVTSQILKQNFDLSIEHKSTLGELSFEMDDDGLRDIFEKRLKESRRQDIRRGSSSLGPHRDDFSILLNGYPLESYGSRGQQRMGILAFLFAYVIFLDSCDKKPVLLLDDVFSELDKEHRELLLKFISRRGFQVIITTTEIDKVLNGHKSKVNLIDLIHVRNRS